MASRSELRHHPRFGPHCGALALGRRPLPLALWDELLPCQTQERRVCWESCDTLANLALLLHPTHTLLHMIAPLLTHPPTKPSGPPQVCGQLGHLTKQCRNQFSKYYQPEAGDGAAAAGGDGGGDGPAALAGAADEISDLSDTSSSDSDSSDSEAERRRRRKEKKRKHKSKDRKHKSSKRSRKDKSGSSSSRKSKKSKKKRRRSSSSDSSESD